MRNVKDVYYEYDKFIKLFEDKISDIYCPSEFGLRERCSISKDYEIKCELCWLEAMKEMFKEG